MVYLSYWLSGLILGNTIMIPSALAEPSRTLASPQVAQLEQTAELDFSQYFRELGIEGSILIYDLNRDRTYQHNPERNQTPFLPASTFKILNSLIALETGAIANELSILTWDGIERSIPTWNRDLNLQTAFQVSAVWFYQVLARRVGPEQMQKWVTKVGYGNQKIGGEIDTFWLQGPLRITPHAQIQFLKRLYRNELPFSEQAIATVKHIMMIEQTPNYTMRAKTGWALESQMGWFVGYLEQNENVYFFATNLDIRDSADLSAREAVTRRVLKSLQLL